MISPGEGHSEVRNNETENFTSVEPVASPALIGSASCKTGARGGQETILLVEDEAFVRSATAEVLESAGYKTVIAGSAAEALQACGNRPESFDLLLADVVMPGMSGRELATAFESSHPQTRLLLMSGYTEQLSWRQFSPKGATYLAKPFSTSTLLRKVREVLDANPFRKMPA